MMVMVVAVVTMRMWGCDEKMLIQIDIVRGSYVLN